MNSVECEGNSYELYQLLTAVYAAKSAGLTTAETAELMNHSRSYVERIYNNYVKLLDPSDSNDLLLNIAIASQELPSRYLVSIYLACKRNGINTLADLKSLKSKDIRKLSGIGPNYRPVLLDLHRYLVYTE